MPAQQSAPGMNYSVPSSRRDEYQNKNAPTPASRSTPFHSFCRDFLKGNVPASGISVPGGIISRTTQLVRGLRNIDASGFEHIQVGNNSAEVIRAVIDGISAFREEVVYRPQSWYVRVVNDCIKDPEVFKKIRVQHGTAEPGTYLRISTCAPLFAICSAMLRISRATTSST
jgi:hypothetical protein